MPHRILFFSCTCPSWSRLPLIPCETINSLVFTAGLSLAEMMVSMWSFGAFYVVNNLPTQNTHGVPGVHVYLPLTACTIIHILEAMSAVMTNIHLGKSLSSFCSRNILSYAREMLFLNVPFNWTTNRWFLVKGLLRVSTVHYTTALLTGHSNGVSDT